MLKFSPKIHEQDESGQWWYFWGSQRKNRIRVFPKKCVKCGVEFVPTIHKGDTCGRKCGLMESYRRNPMAGRRGVNSRAWKGGKVIRKGYALIHAPEHPDVQGTTRTYVLEHRLVMEKILGRLMLSNENVHHINGKRDDNRPENLELWIKTQPAGQRVADLLKWANEIIVLYADGKHCPSCTCGVN